MARPFPPKTEFFINGAWVDVSSYVFGKAGDTGAVSIQHGMSDQQGNVSPDSCTFTLDQADGRFSNRYPLGPYYGDLPRNTIVRQSMPTSAGDMDLHSLHVEPDDSGQASTPDKASLDITGDIDVRIECAPAYGWRPPVSMMLASKYVNTAGNKSWSFLLGPDGKPVFWTSQDGTNVGTGYAATVAIPITSGSRMALRFTLDVNLGGTQKVSSFYYSDSITGTWTLLSSATTATITSIFSGAADLEVGSGNGGGSIIFSGASAISFIGKIYGLEVYSGIAGTKVADYKPNRAGNVVGSTSWADTCAAPNTWTVLAKTRVTSDRVRFTGEMTNLPQTWDTTKRDVQIAVQAYGALRRTSRSNQQLKSPIYRNFIQQISTNLYFPLEDGSSTLRPQAAVGSAPNTSISNISFSGTTPTGLPGSAGAMTLSLATSYLQVSTAGRTSTGTTGAVFYFNLAALPASNKVLYTIRGQGDTRTITIGVSATSYTFSLENVSGTVLDSATIGFGVSPLNQWIGMQILLTSSGANTVWETIWHAVGTETYYTHSPGGSTYAGEIGRMNVIRADAGTDAAFTNSQHAHWLLSQDDWRINTIAGISNAFIGETAGTRLRRLAAEESINIEVYGEVGTAITTAAMGAQRVAGILDLFADCYQLDGGVFGEARDRIGYVYYAASYYGWRRGFVLSEASSHLAEQPRVPDDDRYLINDYTATRTNGGVARYELEGPAFGPNNVLDPPDGVGRVSGGESFNAATDDQMQEIAQFQVYWRTWDDPRIPNLTVGLHRTQLTSNLALTREVLAAYLGSSVIVDDLLTFVSFDALAMVILGYTETYDGLLWTLIYNTVPQAPYKSSRVDIDDNLDGRTPRADTPYNVSVLNADITSTATSFVINSTGSRAKWLVGSTAPDFPLYVMMGGEMISVGQIAAAVGNLQTASNCVRSVNGVVKAQTASTQIYVRDSVYLGAA